MHTRNRILSLAVALAFGGIATAQTATTTTTTTMPVPTTVAPMTPVTPAATTEASSPMVEADVRALLMTEGYTKINDVEFKEGTWTADARSVDGNHVELKIDPATRKVYPDQPVGKISKDQIIVKLQDAGYTNVHDVDMEAGVWKAEANDSAGNDVEIKLDPDDGHILGSEKDAVGAKH